VENSGRYGGTYAAPIVGLMIEKYINDTIAASRKPLEERMKNTNLIPPLMKQEMRKKDSLKASRENEKTEKNAPVPVNEPSSIKDNPVDSGQNNNNRPPGGNPDRKTVKNEMIDPLQQRKIVSAKNPVKK
ncbi:MAG: hypothetical protein AAB221_06570, partial [Bacteroidota bacterium]